MEDRLFDLIPYQLANYPQEDCLAAKVNGQWRKYSTKECQDIVDKVSLGLLNLGIKKGEKVAIVSQNRPEWNFADFGSLQIGAVNVPIYPTISEIDYKYIFNDAEIKLAFVSDKELYDKVNHISKDVPSLKFIYSFDELEGVNHWSEITASADETKKDQLNKIKDSIKSEELATLIYTSGTTGTPKGVMLSHKNIISNVDSSRQVLPLESSYKALSFLPLCHVFERMICAYYLRTGVSIYYAENLELIGENLKEVKPQYFTTVPRLLEKVYDKIMAKGRELSGAKKAIFYWSVNLGNKYDNKGENSFLYNLQLGIARKLVFSKWLEALGGEIIGIIVGAAALQPRLARVFGAAGIKVREGYGQTESSPVISVNQNQQGGYMFGTVGPVIPGVEVKIAENGEILARGDNIMLGYYNKPEITKETIDEEGWLHTGDVGEIVDGKFLKITDRLKEMFKTSGGKYVAPQPIENKMKESNFIEQIMIIGENRKFTSALVVPNYEFLDKWAKEKGIEFTTQEDLSTHPEVFSRIWEDIQLYNKQFSKIEQVKKIILMHPTWTIDTDELTPTMKLKRKVIIKKYYDKIEEIYKE